MRQDDIGKFIAQCRKEKNLTQAQLAEKLGVSDKSVSRWENGKTMMDMSLYEPLCQVLDIQISELLYAKKLSPDEKAIQGEKSALNILTTKTQLKILMILSEILIFVGIIITITFTAVLTVTTLHKVITVISGSFVLIFAMVLKVKIGKAILELEKN